MPQETKILIVDDDKFLLDMYSLKFSEKGFTVETAMSGAEVLEKLTAGFHPSICLIDIIMPGMDGFKLIKTMRERNLVSDVALIILTNLGQKEDIEKALGLGVDGYIIKASATPSEVVTKVGEITVTKNSTKTTKDD